MMSRRAVASLLGIAPFAAQAAKEKATAQRMAQDIASSLPSASPYPHGADAAGYGAVNIPKVDRATALRMIFADPAALAEIRDEIVRDHFYVEHIDPDIDVMKSWSRMAKVTYQRQRNVDRAWRELMEATDYEDARVYIASMRQRLRQLMWGK